MACRLFAIIWKKAGIFIVDCNYANKFQCLRKFKSKYNNKK